MGLQTIFVRSSNCWIGVVDQKIGNKRELGLWEAVDMTEQWRQPTHINKT